MKNKNLNSTRYYSTSQEDHIAKLLGGYRTSNSGAGRFSPGDVVVPNASLLVECKTCMSDKTSFSIKEDWIIKNREESRSCRLDNSCIAINFGPDKPNYFLIDSKLMKFLVEKLIEENM